LKTMPWNVHTFRCPKCGKSWLVFDLGDAPEDRCPECDRQPPSEQFTIAPDEDGDPEEEAGK